MTLVSLYTDRLRRDGIPFEIVFHDKYNKDEDPIPGGDLVVHRGPLPPTSRTAKLINLIAFYFFATRRLRSQDYDFVVVWNDVAILLFGPWLARHLPGRYCLNIRDYFFNRLGPVRSRYKRAVKKASFVTISSDGFRSFLPPADYVTVLSLNNAVLSRVLPKTGLRPPGEPIRIAFIGNVRFFETNKRLLTAFANDKRFELIYYGTNAEVLERFSAEEGIRNVRFKGAFPVADTAQLLADCDIVNNLYGTRSIALDTALSIKLFHGAYTRAPILGVSGTYTAELLSHYGIGLAIKMDDVGSGLPDRLHTWYRDLDFESFAAGCAALLEDAEQSQASFEKVYRSALAGARP